MSEIFDAIVRSLDAPMAVVTAAVNQRRAGCLVGFHAQASIDPERYCVWLSRANHTYLVAAAASHVAVHFLGSADHDLARRFGTMCSATTDKFAGLRVGVSDGDAPVLEDCEHRVVLRRTSILDADGDHVALIGAVVSAHSADGFAPLRLADVLDLEPGHDSGSHAAG